jgi:methyl-accepting chemotaxis protein
MDYQGVPSFVSQAKMTTISNSPVVSDLNWSVVLHQNRDESLQPVNTAAQTTFLISLGTVVIAGLLALVVAQLLSRPILRLTAAARQLAQGNFSHRLALGRSDEIGVLANGFDTMADALEARIAAEQEARAEAEQLQQAESENRQRLERAVGEYLAFTNRIAQGDLTYRISTHYDGVLGQLSSGLNNMVGSLRGITEQVQEATSAIAAATAQILAATTQQAASSAEQSAAITETVTSVEEVKVIAQQTAEQANQIAQGSQSALLVARQGDQAVAGTIDGMNQVRSHVQAIGQVMQALSGHSQAIGSTIASLSELADQITGLAQNAAIEATRAGGGADLGELARLVRNLSERAKSATGEVRERLGAIQQSTYAAVQGVEQGQAGVEAGAARVNEAGTVIRHLAQEVETGAQANVQMAAAAQQQMIGMEQIGLAMTAIQQATTQALAGTQQAEQAAQDLHVLAQSLQQAIATYRL